MIALANHRRTRGARRHHREFIGKDGLLTMPRNRSGMIPISRVKRRLPAAGLAVIKKNFVAEMLKDFYSSDADIAIKGIAQARQHQVDCLVYRKNPSLLPPSTVITQPVVRLLRASLASQQIASAQSFGVTTVPNSERLA